MKRNLFLTVLAICAVLMAACRQETPSTKSVDDNPASYSMEKVFENDTLIVYKTDKGYTVNDTIHKDEDNPDFTKHKVFVADQQGRTFAEAYYNDGLFVSLSKYLYDEKNNVKGLVIFNDRYFHFFKADMAYTYDEVIADSAFDDQFHIYDNEYDVEKILFDLIFAKSDDEPYFIRYYFLRDSQDRIVKVYDPILYNSVAAPDGYHLEYNIDDIDTGLVVTYVSNDKNEDDTYDGNKFNVYDTKHYLGIDINLND